MVEYFGFEMPQNIGCSIYINTLKNKALNSLIVHIKWRLAGKYMKRKGYFVKILLNFRIVFGIILTGVGGYARFIHSEGC